MTTKSDGDADPLLEVADGLYALAPGDFTGARDGWVKEHRSDKAFAAQVKALRKPSVGAWVINLLVRNESEQVTQLLAVGEALRRAQVGLDATQMRELTKQRRAVTSAVTGRARGLAADAGQRLTPAVLQQVEDTLTAAMLDEGAAKAVRSGLLIGTFRATGVDPVDVASALATPEALGFTATIAADDAVSRETVRGRPSLHVVPDPEAAQKAREAAAETLAQADAAVQERTTQLDRTRTAVEELHARELQINAELDELRRQLADAEESLDEVEEGLAEAEEAREEAEQAVTDAQRDRDQAAQQLAALD